MKRTIFLLLPLFLLVVGCNQISNDPIDAAHQYIERMSQAAVNSDYDKGEETTALFQKKFKDDKTFIAAVITELRDPKNQDVMHFMTSYDLQTHAFVKEMMIHCIALQKACEDLRMTPAEIYLRNK